MMRFGSNWKAVVNHSLRGRPGFETLFGVYSLFSVSLSEQPLILPDPYKLLIHFACKSSKRVTTRVSFSFLNLRPLLYHFYNCQTLGFFMKQIFFNIMVKSWSFCFYPWLYSPSPLNSKEILFKRKIISYCTCDQNLSGISIFLTKSVPCSGVSAPNGPSPWSSHPCTLLPLLIALSSHWFLCGSLDYAKPSSIHQGLGT